MKRRHNRQQIIEFCDNLRKIRHDVSFGADIIAGFPTETDAMFENTRALIAEAGLQYLHIFPYSEREGTPAAKMPPVDKSVRKQRAALLKKEGEKQLQKFFKENLNRHVELLMEQNGNAHTENFIPVKLEDNIYSPGQLLKVELISVDGANMIARAL
jgi:threonylcarbamoyladenosine tRNA methylthiotransferase MtaB